MDAYDVESDSIILYPPEKGSCSAICLTPFDTSVAYKISAYAHKNNEFREVVTYTIESDLASDLNAIYDKPDNKKVIICYYYDTDTRYLIQCSRIDTTEYENTESPVEIEEEFSVELVYFNKWRFHPTVLFSHPQIVLGSGFKMGVFLGVVLGAISLGLFIAYVRQYYNLKQVQLQIQNMKKSHDLLEAQQQKLLKKYQLWNIVFGRPVINNYAMLVEYIKSFPYGPRMYRNKELMYKA